MNNKILATFRIHYHTQWGERLVMGMHVKKRTKTVATTYQSMHWEGDGFWRLHLELEPGSTFDYHYAVEKNGKITIREFGERSWGGRATGKTVLVKDAWLPFNNPHHPFFSSAFTKAVFKRNEHAGTASKEACRVHLSIRAPRVPQHLRLCVSGSSKELGSWNPQEPLLLDGTDFPVWKAAIPTNETDIVYKYGLYDVHKQVIVRWEEGENRHVHVSPLYDTCMQNDEVLRIFDEWRGAGVAIPVFSLRTAAGLGCGEFNDLYPLTDWCAGVGLKMIQILPINDTISTYTWRDSYPYNAISVNALHPIYLHVNDLFATSPEIPLAEVNALTEQLNAIDHVDYERVLTAKLHFSRMAFNQQKEAFKTTAAYMQFARKNDAWLLPYAFYSALRDRYETPDFRKWGKRYARFSKKKLLTEYTQNQSFANEVDYYCYLQFHLDRQLSNAVAYARNLGIIVKGDIPIGINRNGVEAWQEPHLFHFSQQAGAPPDAFAVNGQNWGFPTYNWEAMEAEEYHWWKVRFQKMADYFDAYRIDHILGFFRIWEIPLDYKEGLAGHFNPALPLTANDLQSAGLPFDYERYCRPFITEERIQQTFQVHAKEVVGRFLEPCHERYSFKEEFNTENKLRKYMSALPENDPLKPYAAELVMLHYEVLFVADAQQGYYHPRIALQYTDAYRYLSGEEQHILNGVYTQFFFHRHDDFWGHEGRKKLEKLVTATDMLVCGEDLGMIPNCVEGVMNDLMILSLEVQRMPKQQGVRFGTTSDYPYLSVCTPATHDMSTLRGWWEEDMESTQMFYNQVLKRWGNAPAHCGPELNAEVVKHQLDARSVFTVLSMQDWLNSDTSTYNPASAEDERINIPKNPQHYWKYRMHVSMEALLKNDAVKQKVTSMLNESGRG